ncbi:phosphoribosyl-ATP pyrophosphohydrolase [Methanosarcina sp. Mfa9]|uniref:phosphoribosyl-ATP pyrophosphohydrolase n=1 Tax=Methanosarcina sp. Mfa9 TaxID=3439063 RepID=UPI003F83DAB8
MAKDQFKAIRDRVTEIIKNSGRECISKTLTDSEFLPELEKRLSEELDEYLESKDPEELVDLLEVIFRITELKGFSKEELEAIRVKKKEKSGGLEKNLFLQNV